jgi:hypothetical protein
MNAQPDKNRAALKLPPGLKNGGSILSRVVSILFFIAVAMLVNKIAKNDLARRWLRRLFPKFFSQTNETTIDV